MCGSLLSKFRKKKNIVYPGITIFPEPGKNKSTRRPPNDDRGFWDNGDQTKLSFIGITHQRKNLSKRSDLKSVRGWCCARIRSCKASSACSQLHKCGVFSCDEEFRSSFGECARDPSNPWLQDVFNLQLYAASEFD